MPGGADRPEAVDTSVAVPLLLRNHADHGEMMRWRGSRPLRLCGHAWIETYAVLTRLPGGARVRPEDAVTLLESNFSPPLWPGRESLLGAPALFAAAGIVGGAAYDGWVALAARDNRAVLASRDLRAETTYRRLGAEVEIVP